MLHRFPMIYQFVSLYWWPAISKRVKRRDWIGLWRVLVDGILLFCASILLPRLFLLPAMLPWSWLPDTLLQHCMPSAYRNKHAGRNPLGFHDANGRFNNEDFNRLFAEFDKDQAFALTDPQLRAFTETQRAPVEVLSWVLVDIECLVLWSFMQRENGRVLMNDLRNFYQGYAFRRYMHPSVSAVMVEERPRSPARPGLPPQPVATPSSSTHSEIPSSQKKRRTQNP